MPLSVASRVLSLPELLAAILDTMNTKSDQSALGRTCFSFWEPAMKRVWSFGDVNSVLLSTMKPALVTKRSTLLSSHQIIVSSLR